MAAPIARSRCENRPASGIVDGGGNRGGAVDADEASRCMAKGATGLRIKLTPHFQQVRSAIAPGKRT
eukprot:CAMPEP_0204055420 /NCGR_PEP_ID=MMETSP0360-20130528/130429_1 /ASSEMBLY_ACC=CAM_ASM_000342 /TAXON_ID=268821 /ORGANISM="Scrippsiella Hangoei, Strain SHTV-5" /LENGTH=66 /DNA_ID=CAMNT_0051002773 /DNA_START=29 /DNA_END=226 /DNA_ORIENTATION=-